MKTLDVRSPLKVCVCGHFKLKHEFVRILNEAVLKCRECWKEDKVCMGFMSRDSVIVIKK